MRETIDLPGWGGEVGIALTVSFPFNFRFGLLALIKGEKKPGRQAGWPWGALALPRILPGSWVEWRPTRSPPPHPSCCGADKKMGSGSR